MKTTGLVIVLICTIGIYWKKSRNLIQARRCQYNVMTLNQTVLLVLLLNVDSVVLSYFLQGRPVLSRSEISSYPKLTLKDRSIKQSWRQQHLNILPRLGLRVDQSALRKRKTCLHLGDAEDNSDRKHFFQNLVPVYLILQSRTHHFGLTDNRRD